MSSYVAQTGDILLGRVVEVSGAPSGHPLTSLLHPTFCISNIVQEWPRLVPSKILCAVQRSLLLLDRGKKALD